MDTMVQKETPENSLEFRQDTGPAAKSEKTIIKVTVTFEQIKKLFKKIKERI